MNQKFSQLNKDYAKSMAWQDDVLLKRSARKGIGGFLLGLFMVLALIAVFFSFKKPLINHFQQKINDVGYAVPQKTKPLLKPVKSKKISHSKQEYGFYTILPNAEVKLASDESAL